MARQRQVLFFLVVLMLCLHPGAYVNAQGAQGNDEDKDPVKLFNQGQDAHEKGDLKTALKLYDEAIKAYPEFPEAEFQRGVALTALGRDSEAETSFRRALALRADWRPVMLKLAELLIRKNGLAEAEALLTKLGGTEPPDAATLIAFTDLRLKAKAAPDKLKELAAKIDLAISSHPMASLWAAKGALERALGDIPAAKTSFSRGLAMDPGNLVALSQMAEIAITEKDFKLAVATARKALDISPASTAAKMLVARSFAANGQTAEAVAVLDTVDPNDPAALSLRNQINAGGSDDVSALEKQLDVDTKNPALLARLCSLTRLQPEKALDYCRRAAESDPTNTGPAIGFGAALVQAKQFDRAAILLKKLLQIEPENYLIHAHLATSLFELKKYDEAKVQYEWIIKSKPDVTIAYYFLAIADDNLGQYAEALENYGKFLQAADPKQNQLEIDKVNLRLPSLQKQVKQGEGRKGRNQ